MEDRGEEGGQRREMEGGRRRGQRWEMEGGRRREYRGGRWRKEGDEGRKEMEGGGRWRREEDVLKWTLYCPKIEHMWHMSGLLKWHENCS